MGTALILAGLVLIACGVTGRCYMASVMAELHAQEVRAIEREAERVRTAGLNANAAARWSL